MSRAQRKFVRVYYEDLQRDYRAVLYDPTALSTYVRLLIAADQAWPALPELPKATRRADLELLRKGDLVTVDSHHLVTIKGYHTDRSERAQAGRDAVGKRTDRAVPEATSDVPRYNEGSTTRDGVGVGVGTGVPEGVQGEPDPWESFRARTGQIPGKKLGGWLNDLSSKYGDTAVSGAIASEPLAGRIPPDYLRAIEDGLAIAARKAERAEREDEVARNAAKRAPLKSIEQREAEYRAEQALQAEILRGGAA